MKIEMQSLKLKLYICSKFQIVSKFPIFFLQNFQILPPKIFNIFPIFQSFQIISKFQIFFFSNFKLFPDFKIFFNFPNFSPKFLFFPDFQIVFKFKVFFQISKKKISFPIFFLNFNSPNLVFNFNL